MALSASIQTSTQRLAEIVKSVTQEDPSDLLEALRRKKIVGDVQLTCFDLKIGVTRRRNQFTLTGQAELVRNVVTLINPASLSLS